MKYFGQSRQSYNLEDTPIKRGGEGAVYNIVGESDYLAKIYHANVVTIELESKIKYMTSNPPSRAILNQIAWPIDCLYDYSGRFVGFVMPKLKIDAELGELYVYPPKKIKLTHEQKVIVAINICRVIAEVHRMGYVFGDFNPCNIGVNLTSGNVAFLDTDSYHIFDKTTRHTYRCVVCLNGYVAPELIKKCKITDYRSAPLPTFTQETDRFSLAIHIFKLLFNGFTPYNGIPENERASQASPGIGNAAVEMDNYCFKQGNKPLSMAVPPMEVFPPTIQNLFARAFIKGRQDPSARPSAEEWDKGLMLYKDSLVACTNNPLHYYDRRLNKCPYCEADERYQMMMSVSAVYGSTSQLSFSTPVAIPAPTSAASYNSSSNYASKGSHNLSTSINSAQKNKKRLGFSRKFKIIASSICAAIIVGCGLGGGLYYKFSMDAVHSTEELISYLPTSTIRDYNKYADIIDEAYTSYLGLAGWQQDRVSNKEILLGILPEYNAYVVEDLRTTYELVNADNVSETEYLKDSVEKYNALKSDQKALLSSDEIYMLDNYVTAYNVIGRIDEIGENPLRNYVQATEVSRIYYSIDEKYTNLVYNYYLLDEFAELIEYYNNFTFTLINDDTSYSITLASGVELSGELKIPDNYDGLPVATIPENAFANQRRITSVVVPNTVTSIGNGAFKGCSRIEKMSLPFTGASEDASAYEAVLGYIFGYSTQVRDGTEDYSKNFVNSLVGSVDGAIWQYSCYNNTDLFGYGLQSYYYYIPVSLTEITITKQTVIQTAAFNGCENIVKVNYLNTISGLNDAAFQDCSSLKCFNSDIDGQVDLTGDEPNIGNYAFKNCVNISSYVLGEYITQIGDSAFNGCVNIKNIYFNNNITTIGTGAFFNNNLVEEIVVPNSVTRIGVGAFEKCTSLKKMSLPFTGASEDASAYEAVLGYIFGYSTQARGGTEDYSKNFVNSLVGSVDGAIWQYSCYNNTDLFGYGLQSYYYYIPASLTEITITKQTVVQTAAFNGCENIVKVNYLNTISGLNDAAFQDCSSLKCFNSSKEGTADLAGKESSIGAYCLKNCILITNILMPYGVTSIGEYAFEGTSITSLTIPNSVESIYVGALYRCDLLESLSVPFVGLREDATAYEAVLGYIFGYSTQARGGTEDYSKNFVNSLVGSVDGAVWQYSCYNNTDLFGYGLQSYYYHIPASLTEITITKQTVVQTAAFNGCENLKTINYTNGISSIGDYAFQNCTAEINGQ